MGTDTALCTGVCGARWMRYRWGKTSSRHCQLQGRQEGNWLQEEVLAWG